MAIAPELRAQILRLYQVELWRVGTIARQLHVHRDTVRQVLAQSCVMRSELPPRPSRADAYLPFIRETLTKFPTLTASRLHAMVRERGYVGGADYFRHNVFPAFNTVRFEIVYLWEDRDHNCVVVEWRSHLAPKSGKNYSNTGAFVIELRDGQAYWVREYFDTEKAHQNVT